MACLLALGLNLRMVLKVANAAFLSCTPAYSVSCLCQGARNPPFVLKGDCGMVSAGRVFPGVPSLVVMLALVQ